MIRKSGVKDVFNIADVNELYNLSDEPAELRNLNRNNEYGMLLNGMKLELRKWMKDNGDPLVDEYDHLLSLENSR